MNLNDTTKEKLRLLNIDARNNETADSCWDQFITEAVLLQPLNRINTYVFKQLRHEYEYKYRSHKTQSIK